MNSESDEGFLRIGTTEREEAGRLLGGHLAEGRLTVDEYEDRAALAFAAQRRADLRPLFADLPEPHPAVLRGSDRPAVTPPRPTGSVGPVESHRSAVVAGVLQLLLPCGAGRFYTGHTRLAVAQLLCTLLTFGAGAVWPLIDGVLLLVNGGADAQGRPLGR